MGYVQHMVSWLNSMLIFVSDDETPMKELEESVRSIEKDGLVWGGSKLVAVGFGIKKLQITLVVEDEKVSLDELQQQIEEFEDYVQSTDIVSSRISNMKPRIPLTRTLASYAKVVDQLSTSFSSSPFGVHIAQRQDQRQSRLTTGFGLGHDCDNSWVAIR